MKQLNEVNIQGNNLVVTIESTSMQIVKLIFLTLYVVGAGLEFVDHDDGLLTFVILSFGYYGIITAYDDVFSSYGRGTVTVKSRRS